MAQVRRVGGVTREINVVLDPDQLAAPRPDRRQVNNALRAARPGRCPAAGWRSAAASRPCACWAPRSTAGRAARADHPHGPAAIVKLTDVAEVGDGAGEVRGFARLNGRPVVGFQVMKTRAASDVAVEDAVTGQAGRRWKRTVRGEVHPHLHPVQETRDSFRATQHVLLEGMLLAAFVVWLFLRDWRATMVTAFAMPDVADPDLLRDATCSASR